MKHSGFHRAIVAIAMMLIGWLPSLAHDFEVDGIFYNKTSGNTVAVTYKGNSSNSYSNEYAGDVVIPSSVDYNGTTYSVTNIGDEAFSDCSSLTNIQIPNSVTSIGDWAFYWCDNLTSVVIGNSVTSIGDGAFFWCKSLTSIEIPNSVTSIGEYAFADCSSLTSVVIPNSVTSIGFEAFFNCDSLTSIKIGNSVTSIVNEAFGSCSSLTSIVVDAGNSKYDSRNVCNAIIETASNTLIVGCQNTIIPNSVTSIGDGAFFWCKSLTSIEIPNSVTSIGDEAFYCCDSLTSIQIPNSVTSIGDHAFSSCDSLTSIVVDADNSKYDSRNGCNAIIETASNTLIAGCQNTIIPNSVTSIGNYAFYHCSSLTSIEIPNSVTSIGNHAFDGCSGLTSIEIPNSVTSIGYEAFSYCSSLTKVIWNATKCSDFTGSKNSPFKNSENITSFTFGDSVEHIPAYLCYEMSKLTSIQIPNSVTSIGNEAFSYCSSLTSIQIPNSVTSIGNSAFCGCKSLTSIQIPNSVTSIGDYAFLGCSSLTSIEIPNSVTSIGYKAFSACTSLTSIEIGNSVTNIGNYAFYYCSSLTSIEIPNSVTSIGYDAFYGCSSLTSVVWNAKKCSDFTSSENRPFIDSENITSFTFGDSVEHIPAYLCYEMSKLTSIQIPNSVTSIGNYAFYYCSSLTSIQIPNSVTSIGNSAFSECSSLTSIEIGNSVTNIGNRAFADCTSLTSIEIPHNVTSIGSSTFQGCSGLTNVVWNAKKCSDFTSSENRPFIDSENITSFTFGDSVEHIPAYLCYGMSGLTNLEIPNSTTSIGESAFYNGEKLTILVLGNSVILIEKDAFKGCDNIKKIDSKATKAPTIENEDQFSENVYAKADLFVPTGYEDNYKYAYAWSEFYNIKGKDFTVKATSISLDKNEVSLKPTQTVVLTETIQPYDTSNKKVTWSSSDESVATIDANGLVTAIAVGEATITATTTDGSNLTASCKVTVVPTLAESITLDKTEISLEATESATLIATVLPELATDKSVEWSSSDESVAVVDENGVVTAVAAGEATITATTTDGSNLSASCKVIVIPTLAVSIELDQTEASVEEKSEFQLTATILPEHTTNKEVAWSSSDKWVATVDNTGLVTMYSAGEVIITATTTDGTNLSATCRINVYSGIDGVEGDDLIVATIGDNIVVKNAQLGSNVRVYAADGSIISSEVATDGDVVVEAPIKGVYIVSVNGKTFKVMVK